MKKLIFILIALISFSQAQTIQTIGAPTTTVVSRGNFRTDSIFYLPKRTKAPTDTAAFRYQISDSSLYYWTGYQWTKVQSASSFASVDTNIISTRAWRQKGDDSLLYLITQNIVGGGAAISYYLNHGVVSSVSGYKQMSKSPVTSVGADTSKSGNGLIAQFLTDVSDPSRLEIPAGNWNLEMWFSASSNGGNEKFYVELLKYNGSTFTSIASSSANPEAITNGTTIDLYLTSLAIPQTTLALTDRLAFRVYIVDNSGARTITLHTQNSHLCQIITNFSSGMTALNGLTQSVQFFATGTSGTDFNISSATDTHTFNLPTASSSNRGALSSSDWTTFNNKVNISDTSTMLSPYLRGSGTSNYFPKYNATRSVVNSKLYESNLNLLFNTINPTTTTSGVSTIENNGTSAALYVLKTLDTARAYVSFGGSNTMDINNLMSGDIRFYTNATLRGRFQTDGTFRLNSLTGTGSRIVVADDNGVLTATSSATGLVDTTVISTRAYRQKGDDSLGAIIATKGSGTVTSVATGYGLSGGTITTTGTLIADTLNLSTRAWRQKGLDSLAALEISGSGTINYIPKFTNTRELGNSQIFDNGTNVGIKNTSPLITLQIGGGSTGSIPNGAGSGFQPQVQHTITSGVAGISSMVNDGTNNRRIGIFTDNTNGVSGISLSQSTGNHPFVIRNASLEALRINDGGELLINTTTDAGAYTLQVNGNSYISGNVGIGTTSGTRALEVEGAARINQTYIIQNAPFITGSNIVASGVPMAIGTETSASISLFSNNTNRLHITSSGDVGIGTTSPLSAFHLQGSSSSSVQAFIRNANGGTNTMSELVFGVWSGAIPTGSGNPGPSAKISAINTNVTNAATDLTFTTYSSSFTSAERMRITSGGNVGIGTTSPTSKADISGTLRIRNTSFVQPTDGAGIELSFRSSDSTGYFATYSRDYSAYRNQAYFSLSHRFYSGSGGSDALFITSSSESLFGTTTDAGNYRVQVSGNAYVSDNLYVGTTTSTLPFEVSTGGAAALKTVTRFGASGNGGAGRGSKFILGAPGSTNSVDVAEFIVYQNSLSSTATDGVFALTTANSSGVLTERFRITNVGRFGLGNINPQSFMHVSGNILSYTEVANTASLFIAANATNNFQIGMGAGAYMVITEGGGLNSLGTERFRFHANGGLKYVPQSAAPTAEAGTVYYDSDDNKLKVYNGTTWVDLH
jgi:hypothetical protein